MKQGDFYILEKDSIFSIPRCNGIIAGEIKADRRFF